MLNYTRKHRISMHFSKMVFMRIFSAFDAFGHYGNNQSLLLFHYLLLGFDYLLLPPETTRLLQPADVGKGKESKIRLEKIFIFTFSTTTEKK